MRVIYITILALFFISCSRITQPTDLLLSNLPKVRDIDVVKMNFDTTKYYLVKKYYDKECGCFVTIIKKKHDDESL